jgi:hypothetical protein
MNKFWLSVTVALVFAGCMGDKKPPLADAPKEIQNALTGAPKWVLNPRVEGGFAAVGSAKVGKAGIGFARTEATGNGRDELARNMQIEVKNMLKQFTETTGIGDGETVDKVTTNVSKQLAKQTLSGSAASDMWISPDGTLWVLVTLDPKIGKEAVKNSVNTSYRNDQALYQKIMAKKAQEELDVAIEKEFGGQK